jgi:hypothetical protein
MPKTAQKTLKSIVLKYWLQNTALNYFVVAAKRVTNINVIF